MYVCGIYVYVCGGYVCMQSMCIYVYGGVCVFVVWVFMHVGCMCVACVCFVCGGGGGRMTVGSWSEIVQKKRLKWWGGPVYWEPWTWAFRSQAVEPLDISEQGRKSWSERPFRKRQPQAGTLTPAAAPSHWKPGLHLHSWPSPVTHTLSNDVLIKVVLAALWIIICVKICGLKAFTHPLSMWSFLLVLFLPSGCQKTERACDWLSQGWIWTQSSDQTTKLPDALGLIIVYRMHLSFLFFHWNFSCLNGHKRQIKCLLPPC